MIEQSGFYRRVEAGHPGAVWGEGVGWHIHDEQARKEGIVEDRERRIGRLQVEIASLLHKMKSARAELAALKIREN